MAGRKTVRVILLEGTTTLDGDRLSTRPHLPLERFGKGQCNRTMRLDAMPVMLYDGANK